MRTRISHLGQRTINPTQRTWFGNVPMKILLALMAVFPLTGIAGEGVSGDLATFVIRSEFHAAYNPIDNSEAELNKAAAINAGLRLQYLMLHEVSDPELRVCYALRVLESQIVIARRNLSLPRSDSAQAHLDILLKRQAELAGRFRELQKEKAEQADAHDPPPRAPVQTGRVIKTQDTQPAPASVGGR